MSENNKNNLKVVCDKSLNCNEMISIENLSKKYVDDFFVLKNLNLKIAENEIVFIAGKNGSGKTTLLNILSGLDKKYEGFVKIKNQTPYEYMLKNKVSYIYEKPILFENRSVKKNLEYIFEVKKQTIDNAEILKIAKLFKIEKLLNVKCKRLKNYQKKIVMFARAVLKKSELVLVDSPFSGVEKQDASALFQAINLLLNNRSGCVLIVSNVPILGLNDAVKKYFLEFGSILTLNYRKNLENNFYNLWSYFYQKNRVRDYQTFEIMKNKILNDLNISTNSENKNLEKIFAGVNSELCKIQSLGFKFGICKKVGKNLEIYIDGQDVKKVGNNQIFNTEYLPADLEFNVLVLENFVFDADSEYRIL